MVEINMVMRKI